MNVRRNMSTVIYEAVVDISSSPIPPLGYSVFTVRSSELIVYHNLNVHATCSTIHFLGVVYKMVKYISIIVMNIPFI